MDEQIPSVTELEETKKREVVLCNNDGIEQRFTNLIKFHFKIF